MRALSRCNRITNYTSARTAQSVPINTATPDVNIFLETDRFNTAECKNHRLETESNAKIIEISVYNLIISMPLAKRRDGTLFAPSTSCHVANSSSPRERSYRITPLGIPFRK